LKGEPYGQKGIEEERQEKGQQEKEEVSSEYANAPRRIQHLSCQGQTGG
jgi:hypothetical protein